MPTAPAKPFNLTAFLSFSGICFHHCCCCPVRSSPSLAPSYAQKISYKFIILNFGEEFILASKRTAEHMFSRLFSHSPCVPWGKALLPDIPTGTAAPVHLQIQPHHSWLTPSTAVSLSLLISFIPAPPGHSVALSYPNIPALHMASWILPCCCPSGLLHQFYTAAAGKEMSQAGPCLG